MPGPVTVFALHGFLGLARDWSSLKIEGRIEGGETHAVDLFRTLSPATGASFEDWAGEFNRLARGVDGRRVLLGYSLGGRLALHALLDEPGQWDAAVMVSTHPGLDEPGKKQVRIASDEN